MHGSREIGTLGRMHNMLGKKQVQQTFKGADKAGSFRDHRYGPRANFGTLHPNDLVKNR